MDTKIKKKYPYVGNLIEQEMFSNTYEHVSPWKDANSSFYWVNFEYPVLHSHTDWELIIILNDRIVNYINDVSTLLSPGTACLIGPKDTHSLLFPQRKKNQFQGITFLAKDSYMRQILDSISPDLYERFLNSSQARIISLAPSFMEHVTNVCLEIQGTNNQSTPYAEEQCNILFQSLVLQFLRESQPKNSLPNELATFIKNLNNPKLSREELKSLQESLPYSYSNLTRLFKKHTNCTITQYMNKVKLQYSKELLTHTDMTTLMITNELHFESISHFNHLFKKEFNQTPTQYRKQNLLLANISVTK
ncbi:MAG: helix-turn-helix domain-containing protein [Clostridia bacterium]|nr:helix-turn-helix domain-containing protein [Clostridia bacterium]